MGVAINTGPDDIQSRKGNKGISAISLKYLLFDIGYPFVDPSNFNKGS